MTPLTVFTSSTCHALTGVGFRALESLPALVWALELGFDVLVNDLTEMEGN